MACAVWSPEAAWRPPSSSSWRLLLVVYKHRRGRTAVPIAYEAVPLRCLRGGLRSVQLRSSSCGACIDDCKLLVEVLLTSTDGVHAPARLGLRLSTASWRETVAD